MDQLIRGLTANGRARFTAVVATEIAREACRRHGTRKGSSRLLAELLTATALLGPTLKGDEKLSVQLTGDGPIRGAMADVDSGGHVRGTVDNPKVGGDAALGLGGIIRVMRSTPRRLLSQGSVPLVHSTAVAPNVAAYLTSSEQVPSSMVLGVRFDGAELAWAGGLMVQHMPGEDPTVFQVLKTVIEDPLFGPRLFAPDLEPTEIVSGTFAETPIEYRILETQPVEFRCECSRSKVADMLGMLANKDLREMRDEDGGAEVTCRFCNEVYQLDRDDLTVLMANPGEVN